MNLSFHRSCGARDASIRVELGHVEPFIHRGWLRLLAVVAIVLIASSVQAEDRTLDGSGNNLTNTQWGAAETRFTRGSSGAFYNGNGFSPAGATRPSARAISNAVVAQGALDITDARNLSDMVYTWGQFLDHDLDLTTTANTSFNIPVPIGDPSFDPLSTGTQVIPLKRSVFDGTTGNSVANPRQQINSSSSWIDASMVYGTTTTLANWLRSTNNDGKLKVTPASGSHGVLLPLNDGTQTMDNPFGPGTSTSLYVAGDRRANEQIGLTAMHTLFVREHNRLVDLLQAEHPTWNSEALYQGARRIVGGQIQAITYRDFLPALLGANALPAYTGYNSTVNGSVRNEFATAGFRLGHSMLDSDIDIVAPNGSTTTTLSLKDVFFNPSLVATHDIAPVFRGLARSHQQSIDVHIVDDVRNFLFGNPGSGGLDLASLNIQRGRDHGLPDYNEMRFEYGLSKYTSFSQITSDTALQTALSSIYGNDINNIDPWVGMLAEDHLPGSSVGPLVAAIIGDQFLRLRDGDRFFYLNDSFFTTDQVASDAINLTLGQLIQLDAGVANLQSNIFVAAPEPSSLALLGVESLFGYWLIRRKVAKRAQSPA